MQFKSLIWFTITSLVLLSTSVHADHASNEKTNLDGEGQTQSFELESQRPTAEPLEGVKVDETFDQPVLGQLISRLRILTYNVYSLTEGDCETRARTFGEKVALSGSWRGQTYDIVGVQEYYKYHLFDFGKTCDSDDLTNAIHSEGHYLNSDNVRIFRPVIPWKHNGGLGVFTLHPITMFRDWQWSNDTQSWPKAGQGFIFTRIVIPFTELSVDVYVVHINSGGNNHAVRKKQLNQLATKIQELSRSSGNPVLVIGDFNIGGPPPTVAPPGNPGYEDIMEALHDPRDLWLEANPAAEPETGYTTGCWIYSGDASGCDGRERIDFIFLLTHPDLTSNPFQIVIAEPGVSRVRWAEPTHVNYPPIRYVSDHFGVEATIEVRQIPTSPAR